MQGARSRRRILSQKPPFFYHERALCIPLASKSFLAHRVPALVGCSIAAVLGLSQMITRKAITRDQLTFAHPPDPTLGSASFSDEFTYIIYSGEVKLMVSWHPIGIRAYPHRPCHVLLPCWKPSTLARSGAWHARSRTTACRIPFDCMLDPAQPHARSHNRMLDPAQTHAGTHSTTCWILQLDPSTACSIPLIYMLDLSHSRPLPKSMARRPL